MPVNAAFTVPDNVNLSPTLLESHSRTFPSALAVPIAEPSGLSASALMPFQLRGRAPLLFAAAFAFADAAIATFACAATGGATFETEPGGIAPVPTPAAFAVATLLAPAVIGDAIAIGSGSLAFS
jgi:hypothetical protein